jgi:hypothetical protein
MVPRRLFFVLTILAIITLLMQGGYYHVGQASSPIYLEGTFITLWGDGSSGSSESKMAYFLATDQMDTIQLIADDDLLTAAGGPMTLNKQAVIVQGTWLNEGASLRVQLLTLAQGEIGSPEGIYGPQPWVSIMCKFRDVQAEPNDWNYFQGMYAADYPGLDHYWREQSFDLANLLGSGAFGWYTLPHDRAYYLPGGDLDWWTAAAECTAAADPYVNFSPYIGINLMFNDNLDCCAWGGTWYACLDGVCQNWRTTWEPPWGYQNIGVIAHETGHGFGLPHSCWNPAAIYDNKWDVMSDVWSNGNRGAVDPVYGTMGQHTIAYHKDMLGWIDESRMAVIGTGERKTITLERLTLPESDNDLGARILVDDDPSHFLTVEARQLVGYDSWLPPILYGLEEAVVLHDVHIYDGMPARVIDIDQNGDTGDPASMWLPGETYITSTLGIEISVISATDTGFMVSINNRFTLMSDIEIDGPITGYVDESIPFTATVSPMDATTPITYTWEATGLPPVQHRLVNDTVDYANFTWDEIGTKAITVTASNPGGTVLDTHLMDIILKVPIVSLSGPDLGILGAENVFTATVVPEDVLLPITYTWQATEQIPITNTSGLSDSVNFRWDEPGTKVITVTAANIYGSTTGLYTLPVFMPPDSLKVTGPATGDLQNSATFTATVTPITTTIPITYEWSVDGQIVFTHWAGLSDSANFTWGQPGLHEVLVSASNPAGSTFDSWLIMVYFRVYFPIGMRN